jgi:hypothetical protein
MATATAEVTKQYRNFHHWQEVKNLAEAVGVPYYRKDDRYRDNGIGFEKPGTWAKYDGGVFNKIMIRGNANLGWNQNEIMRMRISSLVMENFKLKLELWAVKNNVNYELHLDDKNPWNSYLQIVEAN